MKKKPIIILLFVLFPLIVGLACTCGLLPIGGDKGEETEEPAVVIPPEVVIEEQPVDEIPTEEVVKPIETEETEEPVESEALTPDQYLVREKETWATTEEDVYVGFKLTNQTQDKTLTGVEYEIRLLDATGAEITTDWNTFPSLYPGETLGVFFRTIPDDEEPAVAEVEITHGFDESINAEGSTNPLSVEKAKIWEDNFWDIMTGVVKNADSKTYTDIRISLICYNASDEIIGGGYTYTEFVPGLAQTGFYSYIDTYDTVAYVEAYPTLTYSSDEYEASEELRNRVSITDDHFYVSSTDILYGGVVIQNNLVDSTLKDAAMTVTFYDDEGYVTSSGFHNIDFLFPGDDLGVTMYLMQMPSGASATDYTVYILAGELAEDYELTSNPFQVNSTELTGDYNQNVKVDFTNNYTKPVTEVDVYVLLYDESGQIMGGGDTFYDQTIPVGGSAEHEVYVYYDSDLDVAKIEAWVVPSYWTTFE